MERFQELREDARKRLQVADHLLTITYPLVKDAKLLLTISENLYYCVENAMNALLEHEKLFKKDVTHNPILLTNDCSSWACINAKEC